jgi:hypothetical protein
MQNLEYITTYTAVETPFKLKNSGLDRFLRRPQNLCDPSAEYNASTKDDRPRQIEANVRLIPSDDSTPSEMSHSFISAQSDCSSAVEPTDP